MSLSVDVFTTDESGKYHVLDVPEGSSDLAGFESWRTTVWGSEAARALGARFFPQLAETDLRVAPGDVPEFIEEVQLLRNDAGTIAARSSSTVANGGLAETIARRLDHILDAAQRALSVGGGVLIW
ncbi:hypothetical protein ACWC9T_04275 [Kitasatospora sp. NPDC001159]